MQPIRTSHLTRILIVEDDSLMRGLMVDILADAGYATSEARCAGEALDLFFSKPERAEEIAAVVTDVDMPGEIDGIGLAARLNADWPQIGVIVTSGAHSGAALGLRPPARFLPKPFRVDRLVATVDAVIDAAQATH